MNFFKTKLNSVPMRKILFFFGAIVLSMQTMAQFIYEPEGINMPGEWNGYTNPPSNNLAIASATQVPGGEVTLITTGTRRYQTIFSVASTGADFTGGTYQFKFSSGGGNPWANSWGNTTVSMNTLQNYTYQAGPNNSITLTNDRHYTVNYIDNGYNSTQAIFMETNNAPVTLSSAVQSPLNGSVTSSDNVTVTVTASAAPSPQELVYVRWTNNAFASSFLAPVNFTGNVGTATIPAQAAATQVDYYVFSTTVNNPAVSDADKVTIKFLNANPGNFTYTVNTPLPPVNITFQVDMSQETVGGSVYVSGSFNGWGNALMSNVGGGVYTYSTLLNQGAVIEYKFKNGGTFEGNLSAPCGTGSNRTFTVGNDSTSIPVVCFGSCSICPPTSSVTFEVNMQNETVGGSVFINGNFPPANWSVPQLMTNAGGGIYTYTVSLPQGNSYEYKFINGATYESNLNAPCGNGFNRTYTVPAAVSATTGPFCFGSCSNCANNTVTFRVNMSNETVGGNVYLMGSFPTSNWTTPLQMTNAGGGIYTLALTLPQGSSYTYKFLNGIGGYEQNLIGPCGNGNDRTLTVPATTSTILPVYCFGACIDCVENHAVTFAVNMANQIVSPNGIHLAGGFGVAGYANWSPSGIPMTDSNNDGVYAVTLNLPEGVFFEYKFVNGNAWGSDESISGGCTFGPNRGLTVPGYDYSIPAVCYGDCSNCTSSATNDSPYSASSVSYSSNMNYPNCFALTGSTATADNSVQSPEYSGADRWYKFVAQSSAVSITLSSATQDDAIAVYVLSGGQFVLVPGGTENASSGASDFERLNLGGLTPGQTYYVSVGAADNTTNGTFTLCIQHLMPSGCALTSPPGGFNLCNTYKAIYRGASGNGVSYDFDFTGVGGGASGTTSLNGTNGLISLSHPSLGLRYGGVYDVQVDVNYNLFPSTGPSELITIAGSVASANCSGVTMRTQPNVEVRSTQRCPANLLRSNFLIGNAVTGDPQACGVLNYTYRFTQVVSCADGTTAAPAVEYTTAGASPFLPLGVLPNLANSGAWDVQIRPNFSYGPGVYGPVQRISVANTAAMTELSETEMTDDMDRSEEVLSTASLYPNPNDGVMMNINLTDISSGDVWVRVYDNFGKMVYQQRYVVEESLNTVVVFDQPLAAGVYMVEFLNADKVFTERMVVGK
jgi:hypothetical protein